MIRALINSIDRDNVINIIRVIAQLLPNKSYLEAKELDYIKLLSSNLMLDEEEEKRIFTNDIRNKVNFKNIVSSLKLKDSKSLLFLLSLTSIALDNKNIKEVIDKDIKEYLIFDTTIQPR